MKRIDTNRNVYDEVNAPLEMAVNDSTYTEVLPANTNRIGYKITQVKKNILVKEQAAASPDDLDRGFEIKKNDSYETKSQDVPVGAISVKSLSGNTTILIVEE